MYQNILLKEKILDIPPITDPNVVQYQLKLELRRNSPQFRECPVDKVNMVFIFLKQ